MIQDTEPSGALACSPSLALLPGAAIETLPPELVTAILEFLDPKDLRGAAAVSRLFYEAAWSAGLTLRTRISCHCLFPGTQPAILDDVVQHALRNSRRLSLTLMLIAFHNTHCDAFQAIVSSVTASLPVLVYLLVSVSKHAVLSFVSALRQPAPYLREFVFLLEQVSGQNRFYVPGDIFGGVAPQLRRLVLDRFPLGQAVVPAFSQVNDLHVKYDCQVPDIDYAENFPRLRALHLALHTAIGRAPPASFRCGGLRLDRLVIEDFDYCAIIPAIVRSMDVSGVPVYKHIGTKLHPDDPLWKQLDLGPVSIRLRLHRFSGVIMLVVPSHRRWRRAYHITPNGRDDYCPILALPGLLRVDGFLTYLRVDDGHIVALLEATWPDLSALLELRIDCHRHVSWPPPRRTAWGDELPPERQRYLRCSALETLTLSACDYDVTFASRDVALLGSVLAQCERKIQERAALVLAGTMLKVPVEDALLQETFSSVRSFGYPGAPAWERDEGLWNAED